MSYGFRKGEDGFQEQCPCCGRFPSADDGFYAWIETDPDYISLFCNETCARRYEQKGGQLIDGDRQPYRLCADLHGELVNRAAIRVDLVRSAGSIRRTREMNAELPEETAAVLRLKGMIS